MYGIIVSSTYLDDVKAALGNEVILFEKCGQFSEEDFIQYCQSVSSLTIDVLIVDINCTDEKALLAGIKRFRLRNDARIILLAPGRKPGDRLISQLVSIKVWDIVAPELPDDEDESDEDEFDDEYTFDLSTYIQNQLQMKESYGNASRWHGYHTDEDDQVKSSNKPKKQIVYEKEVITEVVTQDRIVGTVTIAIGSVERRTGCTYTAIQVAQFLQSEGFKTACVELIDPMINPLAFYTIRQSPISENSTDMFQLDGIDYYPKVDLNRYLQIIADEYQYVVIDMGKIITSHDKEVQLSTYGSEFMRTHFQVLTATPALWDVKHVMQTLDSFYRLNWDRTWRFLINLADDESFKSFSNMFSHHEKNELKISFFQNPFQSDPWVITEGHQELFRSIFQTVLPSNERKRKKRFLLF